jgi:hypothetical protein
MVFPTNETCACGKHVNPAKGHIARTLVDADGEISIQLIHKACKGIS